MPRSDVAWLTLAVLSSAAFMAGMGLLGATKLAGYFYLASLVLGAPVLFRLVDFRSLSVPGPVKVYGLFLVGFTLLCLAQVLGGATDWSIFDYVLRPWIGLVNGLFFLVLFRFRRDRLFAFIALLAALHGALLVIVTLAQGIDLSSLELTGERVGGMTNPIPYSNMLFVSIGLLAIAMASRMPTRSGIVDIGLVGFVLIAGVGAVTLTGTRGTLIAVPWLLLLLAYMYRERFGSRAVSRVLIAVLSVAMFAAFAVIWSPPDELLELFSRVNSDDQRLQLWTMAWTLIQRAPFFGHGLDSVPDVFLSLGLNIADYSFLYKFNHMHNLYLDMLVKTGIVGAFLFFGPIVVAMVSALRLLRVPGERRYAVAVIWVVGAYCAYGLTASYFAHANTTLQFGVYLGMLMWLFPASAEQAGIESPLA